MDSINCRRLSGPHPASCRWKPGLKTTQRPHQPIFRTPTGLMPVDPRFENFVGRIANVTKPGFHRRKVGWGAVSCVSRRFSCQTFGPLAPGQWGLSNDISSPATPSHLMTLVGSAPVQPSFVSSPSFLPGNQWSAQSIATISPSPEQHRTRNIFAECQNRVSLTDLASGLSSNTRHFA